MPTPAEQKALAFLSFVVLLGGAVRVVQAGALAPEAASPAEQQALARQASAANSSAVLDRGRKGAKARKPGGKTPRTRYVGSKFDSTGLLMEGTGVSSTGFPPPGPRIDVDSRPHSAEHAAGVKDAEVRRTVDLDIASAEEIERLPGIGPALARRIVASRDSLGPFGALPGLARVKGIGPATLGRLARLVTFSGQARR
jgi:competence ComEA-like helix-hairpin-helix protein